MSANIPSISEVLTMALPRNVDIAISGCPLEVEYALITRSGRDVPRASSVNPIKKLLIFIFLANAVDWSMNMSDAFINIASANMAISMLGMYK